MILFKLEYPTTVEAWPKPVCEFQDCGCLPDEELTPECPDWTESVIERSFLRRPDALARVLGVTDTRHELLVLKQVARIDLYLRTGSGLHLVEMKGPRHTCNGDRQRIRLRGNGLGPVTGCAKRMSRCLCGQCARFVGVSRVGV